MVAEMYIIICIVKFFDQINYLNTLRNTLKAIFVDQLFVDQLFVDQLFVDQLFVWYTICAKSINKLLCAPSDSSANMKY